MGVIDILPACVSSVYFMYDATWARFSLGKVRPPLPSPLASLTRRPAQRPARSRPRPSVFPSPSPSPTP